MKLFEFEAKEILKRYGVEVPRGVVVKRGEDARGKIEEAGLKPPLMVKSQVLVAGRGKAGGVRRAESVEEAVRLVEELFERPIKGLKPNYILVEEAIEHDVELYTAVTVDRSARKPVVLVSRYGGMDIEEIAREHPESIIRMHVDPDLGLRGYHARRLGKLIGLKGRALVSFALFLESMYSVFVDYDAELVESNPLALVGEKVVALDARIIVDDNALYRHPELSRDPSETGEYSGWEVKARSLGLAFVELDGDIGVIGNGAGLTMATMDLVYEFGGRPANFLDVGGGASAEVVKKALGLLFEYPKARKIFINIFGGITRCDEVARGIVEALREAGGLRKPIVVRLTGTNEEEGRRILREAGVEVFDNPFEAARRIVEIKA